MKRPDPIGTHTLKRRRIAGFTLTESLYQPRLEQSRHSHEPASLSIVLAGGYRETIDRTKRECEPATIVFRPPREIHAVVYGTKKVRILNVEIGFERFASIEQHTRILNSPGNYRAEIFSLLGNKICRELRQPDAASSLAIEGLVFEVLAHAARLENSSNSSEPPRWLVRAREYLHAHFAENCTLEIVAAVAGVHPVHLARVFRRHYGCTLGEYVRRLRVEFAEREISASDQPLNQIAIAAGFADQSHFVRIFKRHFGITPTEHRRLSR